MSSAIELDFVTSLEADASDVWGFVSTMAGVNFELHPFVHMTSGRDHDLLPSTITPGRVIFRSWLLALHVLPFDRHSLALDRMDDGSGFIEESTTWLHRRWRHERDVTPDPRGGCSVTDRLVIEPRVGVAKPLVALVVGGLFRHRHRRLERRFGISAPPPIRRRE